MRTNSRQASIQYIIDIQMNQMHINTRMYTTVIIDIRIVCSQGPEGLRENEEVPLKTGNSAIVAKIGEA